MDSSVADPNRHPRSGRTGDRATGPPTLPEPLVVVEEVVLGRDNVLLRFDDGSPPVEHAERARIWDE